MVGSVLKSRAPFDILCCLRKYGTYVLCTYEVRDHRPVLPASCPNPSSTDVSLTTD